jgi:hypothetical protein
MEKNLSREIFRYSQADLIFFSISLIYRHLPALLMRLALDQDDKKFWAIQV